MMDCRVAVSLYDIALLFEGISKNKVLEKRTRHLTEIILNKSSLNNVLNNEVYYYRTFYESRSGNKSNRGCFYKETLNYLKAMIEMPKK